MVIYEKQALVALMHEQYRALKAKYQNRIEYLHVMTLGSVKTLADCTPGRRKVRTVVTDVASPTFHRLYVLRSGGDCTVRWLLNATLGRPGLRRRMLDVKAEYFQCDVATPNDGGRVLVVPAPAGWAALGFPEIDSAGCRVFYQVVRNVPGRQDAGRIWQMKYDTFFAEQNFTQSIVDRRVFFKHLPNDKLIVVYVDDNWTVCDDDAEYDRFHAAWSAQFDESQNVAEAKDDFCGVLEDLPDGAVALSSKKHLLALKDMIAPSAPRPRGHPHAPRLALEDARGRRARVPGLVSPRASDPWPGAFYRAWHSLRCSVSRCDSLAVHRKQPHPIRLGVRASMGFFTSFAPSTTAWLYSASASPG